MESKNSRTHQSQLHDVSVYAIECKAPSSHLDIEEKYLIPSSLDYNQRPDDSSSSKSLTELPRDTLYPSDSNTPCVHSYEVANADGTQRYPLFEELAARSRVVYYIGQTRTLCKRIREHLHQNGAAKFTDLLEPLALKRVNSYSVGRSAATLCEQLRAEMVVASKTSDSEQKQVEQNYQWIIAKIRSSSQVSISKLLRWVREGRKEGEIPRSFRPQILSNYASDVENMGRKKEKQMGVNLLRFENSDQAKEGKSIDIRNLKHYAYWS